MAKIYGREIMVKEDYDVHFRIAEQELKSAFWMWIIPALIFSPIGILVLILYLYVKGSETKRLTRAVSYLKSKKDFPLYETGGEYKIEWMEYGCYHSKTLIYFEWEKGSINKDGITLIRKANYDSYVGHWIITKFGQEYEKKHNVNLLKEMNEKYGTDIKELYSREGYNSYKKYYEIK